LLLLTGLGGSGARDVGRVIAGAQPITKGAVLVNGRPLPAGQRKAFARAGIGFVPEDRKREGIFPDLSVEANIAIGDLGSVAKLGTLNRRKVRQQALELIDLLQISPATPTLLARQLSGGNQQKVLFARWLFLGAHTWLLEEPTHGIDVGSRETIHRLLEEYAAAGGAAVIVSRERGEFLGLCHRTAVFWHGELTAILPRGTPESAIELIASGADPRPSSLK
jgi:ABC-type sugar transport system ATPase subunit